MALVDWASVAVALGLFVATAAYTYYTRRLIEVEVEPYLKPSLEYDTPKHLYLVIRNIGDGAAHDVDAKWRISESAHDERSWHIDTIPAGAMHQFRLPFSEPGNGDVELSNVREQLQEPAGSEIGFAACCSDVLNRHREFEDSVDIRKALDRLDQAGEVPTLDTAEDTRKAIVELTNVLNTNVELEGKEG